MKLSATEVSHIASRAAVTVSAALSVTGVTISSADSGYTEVHVTVAGCHVEPCHVILGVFRDVSEDMLRSEIAAKLQAHLER
jgi:hypothetical protein